MLTRPGTSKTSPPSSQSSLLDKMFRSLESLARKYAGWVVLFSFIVAGLSLWYTAENLAFKTKRSDLISRDLPYDILYKKYREEFEDFDGMIIAVESQQTDATQRADAMKAFAVDLVQQLQKYRSSFHEIFYKVDTSYFKSRALLFMDLPDLEDLTVKLKDHQDFLQEVNQAPGLNSVLVNINKEISEGMVDSLLTDFLGTGDDEDSEETDDEADLSLLISIFQQIKSHLKGDAPYKSPWKKFLTDRTESLQDEGFLVSENGSLLFVLLSPKETANDFTGSKDAIELIRGVIRDVRTQHPEVNVGLTGSDVISSDEMFTTRNDVELASKIALAGVALLFIIAFRGMVKPLLAVVSLMVALGWSMGYTTLSVGHLNIMSVVFTTILIGLGIDFGIHILERYREERRQGGNVHTSMLTTLRGTGKGNLAGAITTAIAFGSMAFTDFIGIAELGVIAAGGILLCWLSMVLLLPALVCLEERWRSLSYTMPSAQPKKEKLLLGIFNRYGTIIAVSVVMIAWAVWRTLGLNFDYNLLNLQAKGTEAVEWELKIIENAKRATWYVAVVSDSEEEARRKYEAIRKMPSVGKIDSIFTALPKNQDEKIKMIRELAEELPEFKVVPEDQPFSLEDLQSTIKNIRFKLRKKEKSGNRDDVFEASRLVEDIRQGLESTDPAVATKRMQAFSQTLFVDYRQIVKDLNTSLKPEPIDLDSMPDLLQKRFIGKTGKHLLLVYPGINIWERPAMEQFLKEMRDIDPKITGNAVHMFESSRLMINGYIQGGLYAMIAIMIYLLWSLRSVASTLLVLIPTLVGSFWTVGFMDLLDVQFNMANLVILPLIIGIGVVNGVHILHRYRENPGKDNMVLSKSTGQAVLLSSLTTMVGFGSLMAADHQGVYSLGLVLSIGVGSCLLASVTLLPALLKYCAEKGWKL